jgi:hypothetical protein
MPPSMSGSPKAYVPGGVGHNAKIVAKKAYDEINTYDVNMVSHQGSSTKSFEEMNAMFDGTTEAADGHVAKGNAFYMSRNLGPIGRVDAHQAQVEGVPTWPGDHDKFKPVFQGPRTEVSMSNAHNTKAEVSPYKRQVNGILPGYSGHVPRARDQFGESHVGGLAPVAWEKTRHMGSAVGHFTNAQGQLELMSDEKNQQKEEERFAAYDARNGGVMPNYAGHRPGARSVEATAAYGKWKKREGDDGRAIGGKPSSWMYNDTSEYAGEDGDATAWSKHTTGAQDSYRKQVGGVLPGYKGFVPGAIDKHGGSHFGGVRGVNKEGLNTLAVKMDEDGDLYGLNQKGHGRDHKETTVAGAVKSGYAGHLPGSRDTWGMTHYDTVHLDADGRMQGKREYVSDGIVGNEHTNQQKTYQDNVDRALHEY